jgi:hypothetical protein
MGDPAGRNWCTAVHPSRACWTRNSAAHAGGRGLEELRSPYSNPNTILALGRKEMAHNHGSQYQIRIVHGNGTEELCEWMNSEETLAQTMAAAHRAQGDVFWLRERNVLCPDCFEKEQQIMVECPITEISTPRYRPRDSYYLVAVGLRNRCELHEAVVGSRR